VKYRNRKCKTERQETDRLIDRQTEKAKTKNDRETERQRETERHIETGLSSTNQRSVNTKSDNRSYLGFECMCSSEKIKIKYLKIR
jgi:hypothetical protein